MRSWCSRDRGGAHRDRARGGRRDAGRIGAGHVDRQVDDRRARVEDDPGGGRGAGGGGGGRGLRRQPRGRPGRRAHSERRASQLWRHPGRPREPLSHPMFLHRLAPRRRPRPRLLPRAEGAGDRGDARSLATAARHRGSRRRSRRAGEPRCRLRRGVARALRAAHQRRGSGVTGRKPFLDALVAALAKDDVVVSCLGANARWLPHMNVTVPVFALCDSMGAAVPLALGIALSRPERHVIATAAAARPANLTIVLWVNGHYESSGGQALPAAPVDWVGLARASGIGSVETVSEPAALAAALGGARETEGPAVLVLPIAFDPAERITPYSDRPEEIRARFTL